MSTQRGMVETYVFGVAEDVTSTSRLINLFRITHWVFFLIAVASAVKYATVYLNLGSMWSDQNAPDRQLQQLTANSLLYLFIAGISLVAGFITWLNTDVLVNRKLMLQMYASANAGGTTQAVVQPAAKPAAAETTETTTA